MKKLLKTAVWLIVILIIISFTGAWFKLNFNEEAYYWHEVFILFLALLKILLFILLLYVPAIRLIQNWWKKKKKNSNQSRWWDSQTAKSLQKFIMNGNAMAGALTLIYTFLLAVFAHFISPDSSPNANDQINEISYRPPGFSVLVLKQPLELQAGKTSFFKTLVSGKKSEYKLTPLNQYWFSGDSLFIERYIGDGLKGEIRAFRSGDITGESVSAEENKKLIEDKYISQRKFILGTDDLGRDYLSRIILGIRVSLSVGFVAVFIALFIGIPVGAFGGYYRSKPFRFRISFLKITFNLDHLIMWLINVIWAIPTLLLVFPIVFAFGQNYYTIFIAVGLTMWVDIARIVRGQVMQVRELEFVQAAKTFAYSDLRTIFRHILPNIAGPVIVITAANFAYAILTEAGLSFLGIGVQPPAPSWGLMISKYKDNLITNPYLPLIPGFAITLLVLAFFMIGNGLRDALDVKTKIDH